MNLPRHMNCEMLTRTASEQDSTRKTRAAAEKGYEKTQVVESSLSMKGPNSRREAAWAGAVAPSSSLEDRLCFCGKGRGHGGQRIPEMVVRLR